MSDDLSPVQALHAALAEAQGEFPTIPKDKTAEIRTKDGGRYSYSYADLGAILAAIRPVLAEHGLSITQPLDLLDGQTVLRTELRHAEGGMISSLFPLRLADSMQAFGSAHTYMRRYALTSLLGVATDDDDDGAEAPKPSSGNVTEGFTRTASSYGPESEAVTREEAPAALVVQRVQEKFGTLRGLERQIGVEELTDWAAWTRGRLGLREGEFGTDADYRKALGLLEEEQARLTAELADQTAAGWPGEGDNDAGP